MVVGDLVPASRLIEKRVARNAAPRDCSFLAARIRPPTVPEAEQLTVVYTTGNLVVTEASCSLGPVRVIPVE